MKLIIGIVLVLVVIVAAHAGHAGRAGRGQSPVTVAPQHTQTLRSTSTTPNAAPVAGNWVITDSYYDGEYGRRTVICMDANGDLLTATAWREVDVPGGRVGDPCPTGRILEQVQLAPLANGGSPR
jgi:hypothetical protein